MEMKLALVTILVSLVVSMQIVHGTFAEHKETEKWFHKTSFAKEKVTKLHFYFHDIVSGKNPTSLTVIPSKSPTLFGLLNMLDDPLTLGPEPTSKLVGQAQGLYGGSGQQDLSMLMALNFVFTDGKYNGSTLALLGQNKIMHPVREMSIVGGTGVFRLARGIATAKTFSSNATTFNAIVEYDVLVLHY